MPAQEAALSLSVHAENPDLLDSHNECGTWPCNECWTWFLVTGCLWSSKCHPPSSGGHSCPGHIWGNEMTEFHSWWFRKCLLCLLNGEGKDLLPRLEWKEKGSPLPSCSSCRDAEQRALTYLSSCLFSAAYQLTSSMVHLQKCQSLVSLTLFIGSSDIWWLWTRTHGDTEPALDQTDLG